ncbi:MAG TPA: ABC transporter ATP-binding protein [Acetobacteraceae bacterium]|nr:ABC transporter ATP-binding protein [Acetobacteraceae bacterium]
MTALLSLRAVSKRFGGLLAVDDVSMDVQQGELVSIIGPNGAGKTTLFNLLTGQLAPSAGSIAFQGRDINPLAPQARALLGFGRTFQIAQTLTSLSALENAMIGGFLHHRDLRGASARAMAALELVGLQDRAGIKGSQLTLSERRRLEVARALALEPKIVLLDEVMAGLNPTEIGHMVELVQRLNEGGLTFLVIEHNLKVVRQFSDRVLVLHRGAMLAQGTAAEVLSNPDVVEAYVGKSKQ